APRRSRWTRRSSRRRWTSPGGRSSSSACRWRAAASRTSTATCCRSSSAPSRSTRRSRCTSPCTTATTCTTSRRPCSRLSAARSRRPRATTRASRGSCPPPKARCDRGIASRSRRRGEPVISVIDYGRGNLGSVEKAFGRVGIPAVVTQDPRDVDEADAVVLPVDGAFHDAMANLEHLGLLTALGRALDGSRPFLGICLGYQLLFSTSEEFGEGRGLDVIPGVVRRFPPGRKVPHMGWNRVQHAGELRLFEGIPTGAHFYFVHSYY